ncbi:hypothetical protein GLAREA_06250 [Glarea lozoyensis ATCC 20868]|uniref:Uncharacterized protein n=1 Tax=Glarea lozoyensis (strain ATCC 20868 / MF5171) TaxID=1116229 RepID=S3E486_GLAL2|nr:uncharacterized protein GLAREA_06250 [Glarea lozoyensis ATCC 20868]EPE33238.1 hypothetical protein GLAREA_06250 [Glarea lozoyensis ATCC 20868]
MLLSSSSVSENDILTLSFGITATVFAIVAIFVSWKGRNTDRRQSETHLELAQLAPSQPPQSATPYADFNTLPDTTETPPPVTRALSDTLEAVSRLLRNGT